MLGLRQSVAAVAVLAALQTCACRHDPLPDLPRVELEGLPGPFQTALEPVIERVQRHPNDPDANGRFGMVVHAHHRLDLAEVAYLRAHRLDPRSFRWIYYLALVQQARAKRAEALESLRRAVSIRPQYWAARLRLAELLLESGDLESALREYEQLTSENGALAAAQYGLGRTRSALNDTAGAVDAWQKACELQPDFGPAHHALAGAYRRLGRTAEAEMHEAAHARSGPPPLGDPLVKELQSLNRGEQFGLRQAVELASAGKLEEAVEAHERALESDPELMQARVNLISLYARLGKPDLAEAHYRAALARNPDHPEAHYNYGVMLFGRHKLRKAKQAFERALRANPSHPESHDNLGYLLMLEGDRAAAESHFQTALKYDPGHRLAHFHLAQLLVARRAYTGAIQHLSRILEPEDERTPGFTYALAAAYARAGRTKEALHFARAARVKAERLGQGDLVSDIDRDIRVMERRR